MQPTFTIIIPTFRRHATLLICLKALQEAIQLVSLNNFQFIISDDGDAKLTVQFLKQYTFSFFYQVYQGPSKGPAANRNFAASNAQNSFLLFIDDDCIPDANLLHAYCQAVLNFPDTLVFEGKIIADRSRRSYNEEAPINIYGGNFWSCNICIHKELFKSMSGFDENFRHAFMEDSDLYIRLKAKGIKVFFLHQAIVIHPYRLNNGFNSLRKAANSILYFHKKNYSIVHPSPFMYFKIFLKGFPSRLYQLLKFRFRGARSFFKENVFLFILSIRFYLLIVNKQNEARKG